MGADANRRRLLDCVRTTDVDVGAGAVGRVIFGAGESEGASYARTLFADTKSELCFWGIMIAGVCLFFFLHPEYLLIFAVLVPMPDYSGRVRSRRCWKRRLGMIIGEYKAANLVLDSGLGAKQVDENAGR